MGFSDIIGNLAKSAAAKIGSKILDEQVEAARVPNPQQNHYVPNPFKTEETPYLQPMIKESVLQEQGLQPPDIDPIEMAVPMGALSRLGSSAAASIVQQAPKAKKAAAVAKALAPRVEELRNEIKILEEQAQGQLHKPEFIREFTRLQNELGNLLKQGK